MNCEVCRSEIYAWRQGNDTADFRPLFRHLEDCPECAAVFERLTADDRRIQRTFQQIPDDRSLESRILAGLAHQRAQSQETKPRRPRWATWLLLPLAAAVILAVTLGIRPRLEEARLRNEVATLLSHPPALELSSADQSQLLGWSAGVLSGAASLPPELNRVEFRGAAAVNVANHKAVFLKMKNEQRASLLVVDAPLTHASGFQPMHEKSGSASLWSDGRRTYVLLFEGSAQEMREYMQQMGIAS